MMGFLKKFYDWLLSMFWYGMLLSPIRWCRQALLPRGVFSLMALHRSRASNMRR